MQSVQSTISAVTASSDVLDAGLEASSRGKRASYKPESAIDQRSNWAASLDKENEAGNLTILDKIRLLQEPSRKTPQHIHHNAQPYQAQTKDVAARVRLAPGSVLPSRPQYVDIDAADREDQFACAEYANEIFINLRLSETRRRPCTTYMESCQTDINPAMRSILIDWLVEVGQEYKLASDTLFLSVAYIDRFLSLVDVRRNELQLVGVTCMLVASKYEEIYAPQVEDFCYITDNTYTREAVLDMERAMLGWLEFDLTQPTTKTFLRRAIKAASGEIDVDVSFEFLASYLAELTLMDYNLLSYLPSHVAASCVLLALHYLGKRPWSATLTYYAGYRPRDLRHCASAIHGLFLAAPTSLLPAAREKYASSRFGSVSQIRVREELPEALFGDRW